MGNWKVLVPDELYYDSFLGPLGYWYYINLCENPSAELGTTGWTTGGTNTLTSDSLADFIGVKGFKATYSNSPTLGSYAITLPLLASTYYVSAFVYVSSINYTGGIISIDATNFSGATVTPVETADVQLYTSAYWQRIVSRIDLDADTSGEIIIKATNPTSGFVYFDAVMIVKSDYDVSYIDGDQDDCEWIGFPHESKSRRPFISRAGGQILDVESDLGFYVEQLDGIGMPPVRNLAQYRGHLDGREFSRTIANERLFRLTSRIIGSSVSDLYSKRREFLDAVKPDAEGGVQPVIFWHTGAGEIKQIKARYDSGLGFSKRSGFSETAAIQFVADDPFFYGLGTNGRDIAYLSIQSLPTIRGVAGKIEGQWTSMGVNSATTMTGVYALAIGPDKKLYIGGNFTNFDNVTNRNYIARWNYETADWETVGSVSDLNGPVQTIYVGPDGLIYIGGTFTDAGGVTAADYLATFNPDSDTWASVGAPVGATVTGVYAIIHYNLELYVAGDFTDWAGVAAADYIAKWNGSTWAAVGTISAGDIIRALAVSPDGKLYAGGNFVDLGGITGADRVAYWDGSAWNALNSDIGAASDYVFSLLIDSLNGDVYAFGDFEVANDATAGFINAAKYDGNVWNKMPGWATGQSLRDAIFLKDGRILAAGTALLDGYSVDVEFGIWNGSSWRALDMGIGIDDAGTTVNALCSHNRTMLENIFIGINSNHDVQTTGRNVIENYGSAKTYPIITLSWSGVFFDRCVLLWMANETTNVQLFFDYQFNENEKLILDFRPGRRRVWSSFNGEIWPFLPGSNVSNFYLRPGHNFMTFHLAVVSGTATLSFDIQHHNVYWSVDD